MNSVQRPDSVGSAVYTGMLRRRWWIVLALTCVGVIGALGYVLVAPKTYTAAAEVAVTPTGADQSNQVAGGRTSGAVNLDTEAQMVTSGTVAGIAGHLLHSPLTTYQLSHSVAVTVPPNSQDLLIACGASTASGSAACAQDFAIAYLRNRSATATATLNAQIQNVEGNLGSLQKTVAGLNTKATALPRNSSQRISDQAAVQSYTNQMHSLEAKLGALRSEAAASSGGHIITNALPPGSPSSPKKSLVLPSGLVAGLLLGLIFAFVTDRRDKRIHGPREVEQLLDLPVVLNLPKNAFGQQVSLISPRSRTGQEFTELGHTVAATLGEGNHVLLIVGASPGPAGSVIAANLAATLARTNPEAVLVCADLRGSVAAKLLGLGEGPGLAELMAGEVSVRDVARGPAGVPGLWVITPGADTSLSTYFVQHDRAKAFVAQLRRDARYVIIEAQAEEDGSDTLAFAEFADGALIVVESNRTFRDEATDCVRRLQLLRTPVLGAAVLSAIGRGVRVRPPRQDQPSQRARAGAAVGDGAAAARGEMSALSAMSAGAQDARSRAPRYAGEYGDPADRIRGS